MDDLAQRARPEPLPFQAGERAPPRNPTRFRADLLEIVLTHRLGDVLNRGAQGPRPRVRVALGFGTDADLLAGEPAVHEADIEHVVVDLPPPADDAARGDVEPGRAPPDFDLLAIGQPEAAVPKSVIQHDADVFQRFIQIRRRGEVERHAHQLGGFGIDEQRPDDRRFGKAPGPHLQRHDADGALRQHDRGRVAQREVIEVGAAGRQWMGHVAHFVTLAEPDRAPKVVLDDAEVVAMVVDVGGQLGAIAPADDALLAQLRRLPVHFQLQLIRFHEPGRLGEPFAELSEEEEKPVSLGFVVSQCGVDRGARAAFDGAARQRLRRVAVPVLSSGASGGGGGGGQYQEQERSGPAHRREI